MTGRRSREAQLTAAAGDPGQEQASRGDLAAFVGSQWAEWEREGIGPDEDTIVSAAAVGLVELVWRNSPLEDMHAGGGLRGRGPSDGEMFAESVALHRAAQAALTREFGLLEFEDHVLDRRRPWAAGGRTLQEMGYGSLGAFARHVRGHTNTLLAIRDDGQPLLLGYLIMITRLYGNDHYGMPRWPAIAGSVRELLLTPGHPSWPGDSPAQKRDTALAVAPPGTPLPDALHRALLDGPDTLPLPVLDWLTDRVMFTARSLTWAGEQGRAGDRYPAEPLPGDPFPRVAELRFTVPAGQRIAIYDELIGDLESRLREARGRHSDDIRERLAYLQGLRSEAQQQAAARGLGLR
jgi:hypothetical protein